LVAPLEWGRKCLPGDLGKKPMGVAGVGPPGSRSRRAPFSFHMVTFQKQFQEVIAGPRNGVGTCRRSDCIARGGRLAGKRRPAEKRKAKWKNCFAGKRGGGLGLQNLNDSKPLAKWSAAQAERDSFWV